MRRWFKAMIAVALIILLLVGFGLDRTYVYLSHAPALIKATASFSRDYVVGVGPVIEYVSLGDSTAAGVGVDHVEESLPYLIASHRGSSHVRNLAISGARLGDVYRKQMILFPVSHIALVTISISANDVTHRTPSAAFRSNLEAVLIDLAARKVDRVILSTTPNFRTTPSLPWIMNRLYARRAAVFSAVIRRAADHYPNVRIAELNRFGTLPRDEYASDGFHPNAKGYRRWATIFNEVR